MGGVRGIFGLLLGALLPVSPFLLLAFIGLYVFDMRGMNWWIKFLSVPTLALATILLWSFVARLITRRFGAHLAGTYVFASWLVEAIRTGRFSWGIGSIILEVWALFWVILMTSVAVAYFAQRDLERSAAIQVDPI